MTSCNRCGAIGHWEEDCSQPARSRKKRSPSAKGKGKSRRFRREKSDGKGRGGSSNYRIVEVYNDGSKNQTSHIKVPPGYAVLDCGAAKSLCGAKPVAQMTQTCAREGKRVGAEAIDESFHFRGIGNQIVSSFMKLRVLGSIDGKEVSFSPSVTPGDILPLVGNGHLIPWGCSIHLYPDECRLEIPSRGIDTKLLVTTSNHILVNPADFECMDEPDYDVWTSKRGRDSEETGTESDMTEGTEETTTDPEEVPAKRSQRGAQRKPRVPRKKPPPAYIELSPALQSELRKLQHAAARGSSASAAEWARVSRAADKALTLLLPDKGPRSMEISTVYSCQDIGFECEFEKEQSGGTQWIHAETVGVRFDSSREHDTEGAEHRGCCIRNADCDSESHRQEMGQVENNDREFQTMSDELTDAKEQLRMASPAERDDPDERSKHGVPRQQVSAAKTICATTVLVATIETAISQGSTTTTISPRTKTTDETRCTKTRTST